MSPRTRRDCHIQWRNVESMCVADAPMWLLISRGNTIQMFHMALSLLQLLHKHCLEPKTICDLSKDESLEQRARKASIIPAPWVPSQKGSCPDQSFIFNLRADSRGLSEDPSLATCFCSWVCWERGYSYLGTCPSPLSA